MSIKKIAMLAIAVTMLVATGCKDNDSETSCEKNGTCSPKLGNKQVVNVEKSMYKNLPKLSNAEEAANQGFTPIHESQIANQGLMSMAGNGGEYNEVTIDEIDIPGVGHTEAAISGDSGYAQRRYEDNLWPGGVKQGAEMDFDSF